MQDAWKCRRFPIIEDILSKPQQDFTQITPLRGGASPLFYSQGTINKDRVKDNRIDFEIPSLFYILNEEFQHWKIKNKIQYMILDFLLEKTKEREF